MALQVTRKEKESSQTLLHRFTKVVRQSGILLELRGKRFKKRAKSDLTKKKSALRRVKLVSERKKQEKLSKPNK